MRQGDFTGKEDLIIKVQSSEHKGDPDLYISKKNTKPNSKSNSDYACETSGRDICTINHSQLSTNQYVYIGVKCLEECRFKLQASLFAPITIDDASEVQMDFQTDETKLFKFYVPAASASKDEESRVSSVTITASPILSQQDNIILTATAIKDETPDTKSSRGVPGWRKGQVLRLSESSGRDWCNDCWITILVDVTELGKYSIVAKSNVGVMQLQTDTKIDDVAFFGDKTCYKYYVQNSDTDLVLKVQQYSGLLSFTVNPKKPAESYTSAAFRYIGVQNSALKISPNDRKNVSQPKGLYYICTIPHMTSTFSLVVQEIPRNQVFSYLEDSYDETGEIQGSDLVLYIYKVPPLEYKGEDIQLNFKLNVISGKTPVLGVAFCLDKKDHKKCVQGLKASDVTSGNQFTKGTQVGNDMYLIVNHDERMCQDEYNDQCYYVVALVGQQKDEEITTYTISINHSQLNYYVLSENSMVTDFVNMGAQKYYSFTLMQDKKIQNVTFRLNTLHGDADLYVSRIHPYPTKIEYEKSSVRTNIDEDEVYFDSGNLSTTYFILVQSFQYSTYNLIVKVQREGMTNLDIALISEGVPVKGKISGYENSDKYKIYVKQLEGYEKAIRLQLQPIKGKFEFTVDTQNNHIVTTKDNFIEIKPTDNNFIREGYYYVTIKPRKNFWVILTDDNYEYVLTYSTQDSYMYLSSKEPLETQQSAGTYQYFRHFINHKGEDISVSMTIFNGNPVMYISINPENKFPTKKEHEYSSTSQASFQGNNGRSVYISNQKIQSASEACSTDVENYVDIEPCAAFVGVYCENDCKYTLKLSYERGAPQKLTYGVPQHDVVKDGTFNYYYLIVREGRARQIYAVLNSLSGNADLYVNFQENPQSQQPEKWRLPTSSQYVMKSTETLKQDMINVQESQLKDCFGRYNGGQDQSERICAVVFGIYSPLSTSNKDDTEDEYNTRYNFVVYSDIIFVQNGVIQSGKVNEREFQYYFFEALCHDCPIVISVSTFASGDPDLYISFGDHNIPTTRTYDMYSSTYKSELIRISLDSEEVKKAGIKTLKGSLIIGVYGVKKSEYQISVTQEKNPIQQLVTGMSMKVSQQPYETTYFMYYHDRDQKDLEIIVQPEIGTLDVYVSKLEINADSQNFADKLPQSKRKALWIQEHIKSTSTHDEKTITILSEEKNFCDHCYYLIGVISQETRVDYSIMVHPLDATFENSLLLKIGEAQSYSMKKGEKAIFKFITDELQDVEVAIKSKSVGSLSGSLSYYEDANKAFTTITGHEIKKIDKSQLRVGEVIYLILKCEADSTFEVQVKQERSILTLKDGVSQKVTIKGDLAKHFIFPLPSGDHSVSVQVKSTKDNLNPVLMFKELEDVSNPNIIEFPPVGTNFHTYYAWDKNFGVLIGQKNIQVTGSKAGLAVSLYQPGQSGDGDVYITVSISSTVTLQGSQTYQGILRTENSFMIYQADQYFGVAKGYIRIEFADCKGISQVLIVDQPKGHESKSESIDLKPVNKLGRTYYHVPLPRQNLYIMVKPNLASWDRQQQFEPHEYILKAQYVPNIDHSPSQRFQETNKLTLDSYSGIFQTANMTWKPIFIEKQDGMISKAQQSYVVVITEDSNLNLESICQARATNTIGKDTTTRQYIVNKTHYELHGIKYDQRYYVNVFSRVRQPNSEDIEVVPYEPYEFIIKAPGIITLANLLLIIFGIMVTVGAYQIYKRSLKKDKPFYREKGPSRQVEYELTSVANRRTTGGSGGEYQVPSDLINNISETDQLNTSNAGL